MNKIYGLIILTLVALNSFAQNCNQYTDPTDLKMCQDLTADVNQAEQGFAVEYNNAVAQAAVRVLREPAQQNAPLYHQQIPTVIQPGAVIQQPSTIIQPGTVQRVPMQIQQTVPVQTIQPIQPTQPATRIHY